MAGDTLMTGHELKAGNGLALGDELRAVNELTVGVERMAGDKLMALDGRMAGNKLVAGDGRMAGDKLVAREGRMAGSEPVAGEQKVRELTTAGAMQVEGLMAFAAVMTELTTVELPAARSEFRIGAGCLTVEVFGFSPEDSCAVEAFSNKIFMISFIALLRRSWFISLSIWPTNVPKAASESWFDGVGSA